MSLPSSCPRAPTRFDALVLLDPLSWSSGIGPAPAHGSQGVSFIATDGAHRRSRVPARQRGPVPAARLHGQPPAARHAQPWLNHRRAAAAGTFVLTAAAVVAFATSALLAREARGDDSIMALAIVSGSIASGTVFAVWYAALRRLSATSAAAVQLSVPAAACAGVLLLAEPVTWRLILSSAAILGGIGLVLSSRAPAIPAHLQPGKPS